MVDGDDRSALDLARTLLRRGEISRARHILDILHVRYPDVLEIGLALGAALSQLGAFELALAHFERIERIHPKDATIHLRIGLCLNALQRPIQALAAFEAARRVRPGDGRSAFHAIKTMIDIGELDRALMYHRAACADLADIEYLPSLATALLPDVPRDIAEMHRARDAYETAILALESVNGIVSEDRLLALPSNFAAAYQGRPNRVFQQIIAEFYARLCPSLSVVPSRPVKKNGPIRVGFVSAHFYNHTIGKLTRGLIAQIDRTRFAVSVFSTRNVDDEIGRFIAERCDTYSALPSDLGAARSAIAASALDVLVYPDIGMDQFTYFLAFSRLAAVQCVSWGHPVTTGIAALDYFISGENLEASDAGQAQRHYCEHLVRLSCPPTYLYPIRTGPPKVAADLSFARGANLYACLQSPLKITPDMDRAFVEILRRDPNGVLLLVDLFPHLSAKLRARFAQAGPDCADRFHFLPRLDQNAFFDVLKSANVVLDTFDFSGGISSAEAFGLGKAVVTLPHEDLMSGRVSYAYYRQMGFADCIASDRDDYVAKAVRLGTDRDYRDRIEGAIRRHGDRLLRRDDIVREFESFCEKAVLIRSTP